MTTPSITVRQVHVADLMPEDQLMPVYVYVVEHPEGKVLVDTGMTQLHPLVDDMNPRILPVAEEELDPATIDMVVNTHLHFDHCGGNHLYAGIPIYVQRQELDDALTLEDYTIRDWVDAPGLQYMPVAGEVELLPGIRLVPGSGHTRGSQMVVVETADRPVVIVGDLAITHQDLDDPQTPGQIRVRELNPSEVWLAHQHEPWRPKAV
ncbi:MBL fold metallo-hydrolase [Leifsonia sp. 2MCAF36]|uniref:MBL fold metallo-hydrolase n=1 Tax=Leifsonia sp. 2MCAF36 TaxID=3232988 RepID=UPI003F98EEC9